jgi:hypothetical protein
LPLKDCISHITAGAERTEKLSFLCSDGMPNLTVNEASALFGKHRTNVTEDRGFENGRELAACLALLYQIIPGPVL